MESATQNLNHVRRVVCKEGLTRDDSLPASVIGKLPGLFQRITELDQGVDYDIFTVNRNDAASKTLHLRHAAEQLLRSFVAQAYRHRPVAYVQLLHNIQHEICHLIGNLATILVNTSKDNVLIELCVAATGVITNPFCTLDPEVGQNFTGFVNSEDALAQILFQVRTKYLVYTADARPVTHQAIERIHTPERLHRLAERARSAVGNLGQSIDNRLIEGLALCILSIAHLLKQCNVALLPDISSIQSYERRFVYIPATLVKSTGSEPVANLLAQAVVTDIQDAVKLEGGVVCPPLVQDGNLGFCALNQGCGAYNQLSGKYPERNVLSHAHRRCGKLFLRSEARIKFTGPVHAGHGLANLAR